MCCVEIENTGRSLGRNGARRIGDGLFDPIGLVCQFDFVLVFTARVFAGRLNKWVEAIPHHLARVNGLISLGGMHLGTVPTLDGASLSPRAGVFRRSPAVVQVLRASRFVCTSGGLTLLVAGALSCHESPRASYCFGFRS